MKIIFNRKISGYSAILLPFQPDGAVDWDAFCAHVARTAEAGLTPAVNMDTGYANLINEKTREEILCRTRDTLSGTNFTAGAFVPSQPGASFDATAYHRQIELIQAYGGIPTIFQSFGLTSLPPDQLVDAYTKFGR